MRNTQTVGLSAADSLTTCPFCSCGCGLYLLQSRNRLAGVAPSASHPTARGRLCTRGWAAHEATYWGKRLETPMVHRHGALHPTTWDDALDEAARRLARLRDSGRAIGVIGSGRATNEDNFMAALLARAGLRTGNLGMLPGWFTSELADRMLDAASGLPEFIEGADVVVVIEGDVAESHPRLASAALRAVKRGGRLVTIGASPSRMTEIAATHLGIYARSPLETFTALHAACAKGDFGGDATSIGRVATWLRESRHAVILVGAFVPDIAVLTSATRALASLAGDLERLGVETRVVPLPSRANTVGAWWSGVAPDRLPGGAALGDDHAQGLLRNLCGGPVSAHVGSPIADIIGSVAGMVVLAEDVVAHARRVHRAAAALAALDSLIVLDAFHTQTSREAHVVLPIAAFGETDGTVTGITGATQSTPAIVPPHGDARPAWHVLAQLAQRLGCGFVPAAVKDVRLALEKFGKPELRSRPSALGQQQSAERREPAAGSRESRAVPRDRRAQSREPKAQSQARIGSAFVLMLDGGFDWTADVLLTSSPTLRRDGAMRLKQWPRGMVSMSPEDAKAFKLRDYSRVRVRSDIGSADTFVSIRTGQEAGTLFVPFALRRHFHTVLGDDIAVAVELTTS